MAEPDDRTLRITATGGPTPQQLAGARRELLRRPPTTLAEARAGFPGPALLAVARVRDLYPSLADVPDPVLLAAAHPRKPEACGWCEVRLDARAHRQPRPPMTATAIAVLGRPCSTCRPAPKPKVSVPRMTATSRTSTSRPKAKAAKRRERAQPRGPAVADTPANRAAAKRLGLTASACGWSSSR